MVVHCCGARGVVLCRRAVAGHYGGALWCCAAVVCCSGALRWCDVVVC